MVPETSHGDWYRDWVAQVDWETTGLQSAKCILFWIPRDMKTLPGLTTNDEWGTWKNSGKVVLGVPFVSNKYPPHTLYQRYYAEKHGIPLATTLTLTCEEALTMAVANTPRRTS